LLGATVFKIEWKSAEWILLAQGRDEWWAVVSTVMNLEFSIKC
jgi:hypothetical protein